MGALDQLIATQYQRNAASPMEQIAGMQQLDRGRLQNQAMQTGLDADKSQRALKFAANVASQINQAEDPAQKNEIYTTALQIAKMNGHDVSQFPQQYDQQAQNILDVMHMQVYNPDQYQAALLKAGFQGDQTKSTKTYSNGLVVQSTAQGVRVISPSQEVLTGKAAADAIAEANRQEVEQQRSIYSGRAAGTVGGKREADIVGLEGDIAGAKAQAAANVKQEMEPETQRRIAEVKADVAKKVTQEGAGKKLDEAVRIYESLKSGDLDSIYGKGESIYPTLARSQEGIDLLVQRDQLISMLKLGARGELKGQGPITEGEQKILGDAVTVLGNPDISPQLARTALDSAMDVLYRNAGKTRETGEKQISTDEEYNALPSGAVFIDPNGQRRRKP